MRQQVNILDALSFKQSRPYEEVKKSYANGSANYYPDPINGVFSHFYIETDISGVDYKNSVLTFTLVYDAEEKIERLVLLTVPTVAMSLNSELYTDIVRTLIVYCDSCWLKFYASNYAPMPSDLN